jgi:hypothetical protein
MVYALQIVLFCLTVWLALYLFARDARSSRLLLPGLGLIFFSLSMGIDLLANSTGPASSLVLTLQRVAWLLIVLSLLTVAAVVPLLVQFHPRLPVPEGLARPDGRASRGLHVRLALASAGLYLLFAIVLLASPQWPARGWLLAAMGAGLVVLGVVVAAYDATLKGEAFLPDIGRSFDYSMVMALLFGGQIGIVMLASTGATFTMLALLLGTVTTAIAAQTFSGAAQAWVDRMAFASLPWLREVRAELRAAADAVPRANQDIQVDMVDEAEFTALVRSALSHFGDLPRLAASPLTRLAQVEARLAARQVGDGALERAAELKALLAESVARLKPRGKGDFGTSDEWRHYNALYFPYIVGLKAYSRRVRHESLDPAAKRALEWLRTYVPERTLYNWQTAATRLVANELRSGEGPPGRPVAHDKPGAPDRDMPNDMVVQRTQKMPAAPHGERTNSGLSR